MQALSALADPTRRRIVEMLAERDRTAGEIVSHFSMSAPAISQHLKVLRDAHLIKTRADGQRRIQTLDKSGLDEIEAWLAGTKRFWERRLDALERELLKDNEQDKTTKQERTKTNDNGK
jgi:DNA-binding transcriptional ArsR family regulator